MGRGGRIYGPHHDDRKLSRVTPALTLSRSRQLEVPFRLVAEIWFGHERGTGISRIRLGG